MYRYLLVAITLAVRAQNPSDSEPVIRTSTRLVQVNVIVHDKNGPVANLTKDDFILTERGRTRSIDLFSIESAGGASKNVEPLAPNTFSNHQNRAARGTPNVVVVLLDGLNTRFEDQARARRQFISFLKSVDPKDRIAIYTLGKRLRVLCDFTDDAREFQRVLASFRGSTGSEVITSEPDSANTGNPVLDEFIDQSNATFANNANGERGRTTMEAFAAIAGHLADVPGRKTLVWVTGSLPFSVASAAKALNRANLAVYPVDARGLVGQPRQLTASAPSSNPRRQHMIPSFGPEGLQTMQQLADLTGGRAFYNTNDLRGALRTAVDDSAVSYTLGFYPDAELLDGKFHALKVQVAHPGLNVRYRKEYLAARDVPASNEQSESNLVTAIESPLESSSIPLSAKIERDNGSLKISWSMDIRNLQLAHRGALSSGTISAVFVQKDGSGKILDMTQEGYDLNLKKEQYETYLRLGGMTFEKSLVQMAGAKTLRILIADRADAAVGSLIIALSQVK